MISKESVGVEISNNHLTIVHVKATPFDTKICAQEFYELDATSGFVEKMETIHAMVRDFLRQHHIGWNQKISISDIRYWMKTGIKSSSPFWLQPLRKKIWRR